MHDKAPSSETFGSRALVRYEKIVGPVFDGLFTIFFDFPLNGKAAFTDRPRRSGDLVSARTGADEPVLWFEPEERAINADVPRELPEAQD